METAPLGELSPSVWELPRVLLQLGHRVASVGILSFAGALITVLGANGGLGPNISIPKNVYASLLMVSFVTTDFALLLGFVAWWITRSRGRSSREAMGLVIFTACVMIVCLVLFASARNQSLDRFVQAKINPLLTPGDSRSSSW